MHYIVFDSNSNPYVYHSARELSLAFQRMGARDTAGSPIPVGRLLAMRDESISVHTETQKYIVIAQD